MIEPILSTELKDLLNYIKNELIVEFPINTITLNYFILSVLDNPTCECYTILSKILTTNSINEFKGQISNVVLGDCQADIKKDDKKSEFSEDYDKLAQDITISDNTVVTSSLLFNKIIQKNNNLQNIIKSLGLSKEKLNEVIIAHIKINNKKSNKTNKKKNNNITVDYQPKKNKHIPTNNEILELSKNTIQMVELAKNGVYDNIIGFEDKIQEIFQILGKYDRNVVAIVGKNGVGKTSLVQKLVKKLITNDCPSIMKNKCFLQVTNYDSNFNKNYTLNVCKDIDRIIFFDDVEILFNDKNIEINYETL
jgi:ATP-dependent Clp protease ATP-binding subunit ClpA